MTYIQNVLSVILEALQKIIDEVAIIIRENASILANSIISIPISLFMMRYGSRIFRALKTLLR